MSQPLPAKFQRYNSLQTKRLSIVVEIEGFPGLLTSSALTRPILYGDPGLVYGEDGLVYGGGIEITEYNGGPIRSILSLDASSLTLSQRLEPEQGRGSISTLTLGFIDKDAIMTELVSPGIILDDILGKKVKIWLGYVELNFPEDYYVIFRGKVTDITQTPGLVRLALSDPNIGRRSQIFFQGQTKLSSAITDADTTINVAANGDFHKSILGPNGLYDAAIKTYLKIGDEFIEYGPSFSVPSGTFGVNTWTGVIRGSRFTTPQAHDADTDVEAWVQIEDHAIDMALKIMLSGWGGVYTSDQPLLAIRDTGDPILGNIPGALILPLNVDAKRDYGLFAGDYITLTGTASNDGTYRIVSFENLANTQNNIIVVNAALVTEATTTGTMSFRSQYDTYPITCGAKLTPDDVDVERHIYYKNTFLSADSNAYRIFISQTESSAKAFLEAQVYLPIACYSLTRNGRLSMGLTKPPVAEETLQFLTKDNILNADTLTLNRGITNRRFFNEIDWQYDERDDGSYQTLIRTLDTESLSIIKLSYVLPITSRGIRSDLNPDAQITRRTNFLLSRYKRGAVEINPLVNWEVGVQIEAGDVVALQDNGVLQIANYKTGKRLLGTQLFEVTERSMNLKSGNVQLKIISGIPSQADDRYGVISPSSLIASATVDRLTIQDSFGALYPGDEQEKWVNYIGEKIIVHDDDWNFSEEVTLVGFVPADPYTMIISPALSVAPPSGYIVDIPAYPTSLDTYVNSVYKAIHAFLDPTVSVVSGSTQAIFTVASGDIAKFNKGSIVIVHEIDWAYQSPELFIEDVDTGTNTVTLSGPCGFVPSSADFVDLIGFADLGAAYRWL
ncbi:MAG: hypothetical protein BWZ03_00087 [bacterium ADurb.BinA186]|nr:MAG: hypothetical protein BWZ03_00087 [bacterium ADurb.BinA186]